MLAHAYNKTFISQIKKNSKKEKNLKITSNTLFVEPNGTGKTLKPRDSCGSAINFYYYELMVKSNTQAQSIRWRIQNNLNFQYTINYKIKNKYYKLRIFIKSLK